jgi:hypothetical protein
MRAAKRRRPWPGTLNSSIQQQMLKQLTARLDQWADLLFPVHAQMMAIQVGPGFASVGDALPTKPQQHLTSVLALFRSRVRIPKVGSAEVG